MIVALVMAVVVVLFGSAVGYLAMPALAGLLILVGVSVVLHVVQQGSVVVGDERVGAALAGAVADAQEWIDADPGGPLGPPTAQPTTG